MQKNDCEIGEAIITTSLNSGLKTRQHKIMDKGYFASITSMKIRAKKKYCTRTALTQCSIRELTTGIVRDQNN